MKIGEHAYPGVLVIVGTPIGNIGDMPPRAIAALRDADVICCEDTRRTGKLLEHAGVKRTAPFIVINDHTEAGRIGDVLEHLARGARVAVVSDAGMPGVSDPGERLVRAVVAYGYQVEVVPGPSAVVTALVVSGLPTGRFVFEGFLPRKGPGRRERLAALATEQRTIVLYEAPHRLSRTLADLRSACGSPRRVALARELTKLHEEVWRGTLEEAVEWAEGEESRGEFVIVLDGAPEPEGATTDDIRDAVLAAISRGLSTKDAAAEVAQKLGVSKRKAYAVATKGSGAEP